MANCETCDYCTYIGEGDFICDREDEPMFVIEDWQPVMEPCEFREVSDG